MRGRLAIVWTAFALGACFLPRLEPEPEPDPCTECTETSCKTEYDTCLGNPACSGLLQCVTFCGDEDCVTGCLTDVDSTALVDGLALQTCTGNACGDVCPDFFGGGGGAGGAGAGAAGGGGAAP